MKLPANIFREYDIRGIVGKELNTETSELIGKGFGTYIQKISGKNIVVSCDSRKEGPELKEGLIKGLLSTGCKVTDVGIALSPLLYFAVCNYGFDGGISVTGSHNPIQFNGYKLTQKNAIPVCGKEIQEIRQKWMPMFTGTLILGALAAFVITQAELEAQH